MRARPRGWAGRAGPGGAGRGGAGPGPAGQAPLRADGGLGGGLHARLVQAGVVLARCFLDGPAGTALAAEAAAAAAGGGSLRLAVEVPDPGLARLPWETLVLPGGCAAGAAGPGADVPDGRAAHPPAAIQVRGPLRILAVIASPRRRRRGAAGL